MHQISQHLSLFPITSPKLEQFGLLQYAGYASTDEGKPNHSNEQKEKDMLNLYTAIEHDRDNDGETHWAVIKVDEHTTIKVDTPKNIGWERFNAIGKVLRTIKYSEILNEDYEFKSITVGKPFDHEASYELIVVVGRKGNDYLNHVFQVFIGKRGGLSAYHGPISKRHGPGCVLTNGRLPR